MMSLFGDEKPEISPSAGRFRIVMVLMAASHDTVERLAEGHELEQSGRIAGNLGGDVGNRGGGGRGPCQQTPLCPIEIEIGPLTAAVAPRRNPG